MNFKSKAILATVCGAVVLYTMSSLPLLSPKTSDESAENACVAAQELVEERLRAPSAADFSLCDDETATKGQDSVWSVGGTVDAENAFGAKLRSNFLVRMSFDDSADPKWQSLSVEIEQQ